MRDVFFIPPLNKMSGGLANIYDLALALAEAGREVTLCHMDQGAPGLEDMARRGLALDEWNNCTLEKGDIWCIPEGWPNVIAKGVDAGARSVVYAQNWAYLTGVLPDGVRWKELPVEFIAVSEPVAWFMRQVLDVRVNKVLPPVVRECFFRPDQCRGERREKRIKVAWMPRKNSALARQIQLVSLEILRQNSGPGYLEWVELQNMEQEEVAEKLASCDIFLMTSMAEGFGLPPVEAMASGCVPVGFAGLGGWEYMRSSPLSPCHEQVVASLPPGLALAEKTWGPNGFYAPEGDVVSASLALASAIKLALRGGPDWLALQDEGRKTAAAYSRKALAKRLALLWNWS